MLAVSGRIACLAVITFMAIRIASPFGGSELNAIIHLVGYSMPLTGYTLDELNVTRSSFIAGTRRFRRMEAKFYLKC